MRARNSSHLQVEASCDSCAAGRALCLYAADIDFSKPSVSVDTGDTEKLLAFFILIALQTILHMETACPLHASYYCPLLIALKDRLSHREKPSN